MREFVGEIMSIETVAQYLGVSERTIYRLMKKQSLPASRVGAQWRFEKKALDEWLKWNRR